MFRIEHHNGAGWSVYGSYGDAAAAFLAWSEMPAWFLAQAGAVRLVGPGRAVLKWHAGAGRATVA